MTTINIEVPAIPNNVGHLDLEVSTDSTDGVDGTWQELITPDTGSGVTQISIEASLDNPGLKLFIRMTATRGPVLAKTMKVVYS